MGAAAVGLDDEALVGPEEVDFVVLDDVIDERPREGVVVAQTAEDGFELGAGELVVAVELDCSRQPGASGMVGVARQRPLDRFQVE